MCDACDVVLPHRAEAKKSSSTVLRFYTSEGASEAADRAFPIRLSPAVPQKTKGAMGALPDRGGVDGTRTRDPRRDRPVF
jgi:hypothetical protein